MNQSLDDLIRAGSKPIKKAPRAKVTLAPRQPVRGTGILQRIKRKEESEESGESEDSATYEQMLAQERRLESQSQLIRQKRQQVDKAFKTLVLSNIASDIQVVQLQKVFSKFGCIEHISVEWAVQEEEGTLGEVKIQYSTMLEAHRA